MSVARTEWEGRQPDRPDRTVPILMYHSIAADSAPRFSRFTVHPAEFKTHMGFLAEEGYSLITAAELVTARMTGASLPSRSLVLTFDDGFCDFYTAALPVLRDFGYSATLYVPTGYIDGNARWLWQSGEANRKILSWRALRQIADEKVEIASHSHTHPQLDRIPRSLIQDEVHRSKKLLEDKLGQEIHGFAYPFGYWNRAARAVVASAGYQYGCAVSELASRSTDDVLTLPRLSVNAGVGVHGIADLLAAPQTFMRGRVSATKRVAWREIRKMRRTSKANPLDGRSL